MPSSIHYVEPSKENCFDYLKDRYASISEKYGKYGSFVVGSNETPMETFFAHVEKLSSFLMAKGFKKNDVAAVFLPTCADAVVAFYALNRAGMITQFIHPLTPPEAVKNMLAEAKTKILFISDLAMPKYTEAAEGLFTIQCSFTDYAKPLEIIPEGDDAVLRFSDIINSDTPLLPPCEKDSRETSVYMHGSGTTGIPKVVQLSSYALNCVAYGQVFIDKYHDYGKAYSICALPCFHSFGLGAAIHNCLCNAYTLIPMPKFDPVAANNIIAKYNVQYIAGAPTMFKKMYESENFINDGLKNLTVLYSGGDLVSESFILEFNRTLREHGGKGQLFRGWGLTEMCAVCSTNNHYDYKPNSIGKPLEGLDVAIFDEEHNKLPAGTQGEIALSGYTMMNGYLNSDYSGIYTDNEGKKWVCTGDMGYVDEDGFLFFTGRKKRIIIISGYNIYPYAIEQGINTFPYVNEACAVQGYNEEGKPFVKLCVSLNETDKSHEEITTELIKYCQDNFDKFSVPRKVVFLDSLPRTKMDKIDFLSMSDPVPTQK